MNEHPQNFDECVEYLYTLRLSGMKLGLENTRRLAQSLELPGTDQQFIHVAGTNGKGSVCAFLESIYRTAGYRTGLFTSPHLVHFNERIRISGVPVSREKIVELTRMIAEAIETHWSHPDYAERKPTFFEATTVMALHAFQTGQCRINIMETGLGGRLDATNIITPLASIITSIGLDHQKWLGNTLPEIAGEKAGIIKAGVPAISAPASPEVRHVLESKAMDVGTTIDFLDEEEIQTLTQHLQPAKMPGHHQRINLALALKSVDILQSKFPVSKKDLESGVDRTVWPARLQTIALPNGREFLLDGAHNPEGIEALVRYLHSCRRDGQRWTFVVGLLSDRPMDKMLAPLFPLADGFVFCPVHSERGCHPDEVMKCALGMPGCPADISISDDPARTIIELSLTRNVVAAGSLHFAGGILKSLNMSPFQSGGAPLENDRYDLNEFMGASGRFP